MKVKNPYILEEKEIINIKNETYDTVTLTIEAEGDYKPGQYNMIYIYGVGEVPITISGKDNQLINHTVRKAGDVTKHIVKLKEGQSIYLRGPYGNEWSLEEGKGKHLILISGGLGLAAVKWVFEESLKIKNEFKRITLLYGSKSFDSLLYRYKYDEWSKEAEFKIILDRKDIRWNGPVGLITDLISETEISEDSVVFMCGPDPMVKFSVLKLIDKGVPLDRIFVSMERHMKCSVGTCGHCMFGPYFVCKDGPIFKYSTIKEFFERKEV